MCPQVTLHHGLGSLERSERCPALEGPGQAEQGSGEGGAGMQGGAVLGAPERLLPWPGRQSWRGTGGCTCYCGQEGRAGGQRWLHLGPLAGRQDVSPTPPSGTSDNVAPASAGEAPIFRHPRAGGCPEARSYGVGHKTQGPQLPWCPPTRPQPHPPRSLRGPRDSWGCRAPASLESTVVY